jgi:hypothetical protein
MPIDAPAPEEGALYRWIINPQTELISPIELNDASLKFHKIES